MPNQKLQKQFLRLKFFSKQKKLKRFLDKSQVIPKIASRDETTFLHKQGGPLNSIFLYCWNLFVAYINNQPEYSCTHQNDCGSEGCVSWRRVCFFARLPFRLSNKIRLQIGIMGVRIARSILGGGDRGMRQSATRVGERIPTHFCLLMKGYGDRRASLTWAYSSPGRQGGRPDRLFTECRIRLTVDNDD